MKVLSRKADLTPEQVLVLASISTNNEAIQKVADDDKHLIEIENVILDNKLLSKSCKEFNNIMYTGALHFILFYAGFSDRIISEALNDKDIYFESNDMSLKEVLNNILGNEDLLKTLNPSTLMNFLNKNSNVSDIITRDQVKLIVKILMDLDDNRILEHIARMFLDSSIHEYAQEQLSIDVKFLKSLTTEIFCEIIPVAVDCDNDYKINNKVLAKETVKRYNKQEDRETIIECLLELDNHAMFLLSTMVEGLKESDILYKTLNMVIDIDPNKLNECGEEAIDMLLDAVDNKAITDDCISSFTLLSEACSLLVSHADSVNDFTGRSKKHDDADCAYVIILKSCADACNEKIKFDLVVKVINIIKTFTKKFTRNKTLNELYEKFSSKIDYIVAQVSDDDKKMFTDIAENIYKDFQACSNTKSRAELIKKLKDLIKELDEIIKELDDQQTSNVDMSAVDVDFLYEILGIEDSDREDLDKLRSAYRKWAVNNHPDMFQDEEEKKKANNQFILVNNLYRKETKRLENKTTNTSN